MIKIQEPIWNGTRDVLTDVLTLKYNPRWYTNHKAAARGLYKALCKISSPKEVLLLEEGTRVSWESGPFEWAIPASFQIVGPWGYTEPYYNFDLCFVE